MSQLTDLLKSYSAFVLAALTSLIYFYTYSFEKSYLEAFGISDNYVNVDLNMILMAGSRVILTIIGVSSLGIFLYINLRKRLVNPYVKTFVVGQILAISLYLLFTAFTMPLFIQNWYWITIEGCIIMVTVGELIFNVREKKRLVNRSKNGVEDTLDVCKSTEVQVELPTRKDSVLNIVLVLSALSAYLLYVFFTQLGNGQAMNKRVFEVVEDSVQYVVVRRYSDQLICVDYDSAKKKIGDRIVLIKLSANDPIVFTKKDLGHIADRHNLYFEPDPVVKKQLRGHRLNDTTKKKENSQELNTQDTLPLINNKKKK
jgi:hypothetical protein